jgi:hypothetical protein
VSVGEEEGRARSGGEAALVAPRTGAEIVSASCLATGPTPPASADSAHSITAPGLNLLEQSDSDSS